MKIFAILPGLLCSVALLAAPKGNSLMTGKVLDKSTGDPLGWATVSLMKADSTLVAGSSCNEKGEYELGAAPGSYIFTASLIGYKDASVKVTLSSGTMTRTDITLDPDSKMLSGATVTDRVKLVEVKIDKVVMNVRESAFAQGGNALELLKKAPGVIIDKDGNVKLNGKQVSVWIDGRPSNLDGKSLEAFLRSTDGENLDKFELMEHPSAKYDAAGQGGIINIKTKRNFKQGFNGSVGMSGGGMYYKNIGETPWNQTFRANLAFRGKKTNSFLNLYERMDASALRIENDLTIPTSEFLQKSATDFAGLDHDFNVKFGSDWFIDDKNTLGFIAFIPGNYSYMNSKSSVTEQSISGVVTQNAVAGIKNGPSRTLRHNLNLNYTHIFDEKKSSEITTNLDYFHNVSKDGNSQRDTTYFATAPLVPVVTEKAMISDQKYDIYSAKADFQSVVWKKMMIEAGAKWALSRTMNNSIETETLVPDNVQDFTYREHVAALYASLAGQLGPKWSFKVGLRGEYTNSLGDWKSSGTETRRSYFDVFPTAFLGWQPSEKWNLNLSYSRRIHRPSYYQLNPTKTFMDAKSYIVGNPDILPEYGGSLSYMTSYGQHLSWVLGYRYGKNTLYQMPSYDADGTQYLIWGNFGHENSAYLGMNVSALPVGKWLQWSISTYGIYFNTVSDASGSARSSWCVNAYTDLSFVLPKDWRIDADAYFQTPMIIGCYRVHTSWGANLAIKKSLLQNKLILALKVDDLLRSSNMDLDVLDESGSGAMTAIRQAFNNQKIVFDITWNFGKAQKPARSRKVGNLEEMSRAGSGGGGVGK